MSYTASPQPVEPKWETAAQSFGQLPPSTPHKRQIKRRAASSLGPPRPIRQSELLWLAGYTGLVFDTGKRIKRTEGSVADAEGEARRAQVLARINGDEAADAFAKQPKTDAELLRERARLGPVSTPSPVWPARVVRAARAAAWLGWPELGAA